MAEYDGTLATMDEMMLETVEKIHKICIESTYLERHQILLPPLDPIARMPTSSVELTIRKDEIMALLWQM